MLSEPARTARDVVELVLSASVTHHASCRHVRAPTNDAAGGRSGQKVNAPATPGSGALFCARLAKATSQLEQTGESDSESERASLATAEHGLN